MISKFDEICSVIAILGALQRKKIQKIRDYYGSWWVGPGLARNFLGEIVPK